MYLVFALIFGVITGAIADKYERNVIGWGFFGFMMFILALPFLLIAGPLNMAKCPECQESIKDNARICKHCRSRI